MIPSGLMSFPLTPFTPADEVDTHVFTDHVEDQLAHGPAALFVACGTGEYSSLSAPEYAELVRHAVRVVAGRVPVFAGAGGGLGNARAAVAAASDAGADGILLLPPYLVGGTEDGYLAYVESVAGAGRLPVLVYRRGLARIGVTTALRLLDVPQVAGIKEGEGDLDSMARTVTAVRTSGHPRAETFAFLNGLPTAEVSATACRAIGVRDYSSAVLCFAPDIARAFHTALTTGDTATTDRLLADFYLPLTALRDQVPGYAVSLVKAGARLRGLDVGHVRAPLVDAAPDHVDQLKDLLAQGRRALAETTGAGGGAAPAAAEGAGTVRTPGQGAPAAPAVVAPAVAVAP
ncbi:5-dehydro-4-deoxyglucarate dehydratase [Streptomyces sp. MBT42]|uniref:5-dehydro-4-deoxyglucarate dehydratase n=1 Tax=Streptomyces sp. MBT42 TaxID=1488373 RepID=UPI001E5B8B3C|nr:5-dehydro-4-deoxyglucarate dehydratase [Streptomyces sp. MBT42]MCD2469064.1 5-dehydro-4-deoxyglucarate dehydratase [Streptomyces sp. MBT42]